MCLTFFMERSCSELCGIVKSTKLYYTNKTNSMPNVYCAYHIFIIRAAHFIRFYDSYCHILVQQLLDFSGNWNLSVSAALCPHIVWHHLLQAVIFSNISVKWLPFILGKDFFLASNIIFLIFCLTTELLWWHVSWITLIVLGLLLLIPCVCLLIIGSNTWSCAVFLFLFFETPTNRERHAALMVVLVSVDYAADDHNS